MVNRGSFWLNSGNTPRRASFYTEFVPENLPNKERIAQGILERIPNGDDLGLDFGRLGRQLKGCTEGHVHRSNSEDTGVQGLVGRDHP